MRTAAKQLHLSQPAVSARIAALEEYLGTSLFERHPKGVNLTVRGHALFKYCEQIVTILEEINANVADPEAITSTLRIGVSEAIAQTWLPQFTARLNQTFPKITLELSVDVTPHLRDALLDRTLDLAILMGPLSHHQVENLPLPAFELFWLKSPSIDFGVHVDPGEFFRHHPIVSFGKNTRPYNDLKQELDRRYGPGTRLFPSTSLTACIRMVSEGLGVGAFPRIPNMAALGSGNLTIFDPGWKPKAMQFTASWLAAEPSFVSRQAAEIAQEVAIQYDHTTNEIS